MERNTISAIRARRLLRGQRLADVAAPAGISAPFLSRLERGQRGASDDVIRRLASILDVPVEELFEVNK
ncbi:helix-turn-helix transcriptional regulator [bacterium]|nr:helix-turn-helix transcriptional regulator [bacterium]